MATNINENKNVYICGPWYGENTPERFVEFVEVYNIIRERGYSPNFPAFFTAGKLPPMEEYLKETLGYLLLCQYIYLMRGWQECPAAVFEYVTAVSTGIPVLCDEGEFPDDLDLCFPPDRRNIRTPEPSPGAKNKFMMEFNSTHGEDNEGFQEYYRNRVLPSFTEQQTEQTN